MQMRFICCVLLIAAVSCDDQLTIDQANKYLNRFYSFIHGGDPSLCPLSSSARAERSENEMREQYGFHTLNKPYNKPPGFWSPEPDSYMNVSELITSKGYGCEEHSVETSPENHPFILSIQRVLSPTKSYKTTKVAVILQHGLLDSSTTWVMNQPNNSLGFLLADQGFDVWMSNMRGNRYSTERVNLNPNKQPKDFWDWSWDEMAQYDIPAIINYVTEQTGYAQVYYVGHSQGTLTALAGFSENKAIEKKVKKAFLLAPIMTMGHCEGFLPWIAVFHGLAYFWLNLNCHEDILPSTPLSRWAGRNFCGNPINQEFCESCTFMVCGPDWNGYNASRSDVYDSQFPSGTSLKNLNHWAQSIYTNKCQMYDYGWFDNPLHYGAFTHEPPVYKIQDVTVPLSLFSGGEDYLADPKDVQNLINTASNAIVYHKEIDYFDHLDFVWGMQATEEVYNEIINQIWAEQ